jgi:hypothetical protein
MIDLYCERTDPSLLAEPLNAVTNLAFLIAAWCAWRLGRRLNVLSAGVRLLVVLLVSIGIGSALYHTFATNWARLLDVFPILLFQFCFLWIYARRIAGLNYRLTLGAAAAVSAAGYVLEPFRAVLNGSLMYAPAFILLASLGLYHFRRKKQGRLLLLAATGVFAVALVFRTVDQAICPSLPVGTHFVWHLLTGVVLYLSMRALLLNSAHSPYSFLTDPSPNPASCSRVVTMAARSSSPRPAAAVAVANC